MGWRSNLVRSFVHAVSICVGRVVANNQNTVTLANRLTNNSSLVDVDVHQFLIDWALSLPHRSHHPCHKVLALRLSASGRVCLLIRMHANSPCWNRSVRVVVVSVGIASRYANLISRLLWDRVPTGLPVF